MPSAALRLTPTLCRSPIYSVGRNVPAGVVAAPTIFRTTTLRASAILAVSAVIIVRVSLTRYIPRARGVIVLVSSPHPQRPHFLIASVFSWARGS